MNRLWRFAIFVNARFRLDTDVHAMCAVDICDRHFLCSKGNSDIRLLLFLKGHADRHVNSVGMLNTLERLCR